MVQTLLDAEGLPTDAEWEQVLPVIYCADWRSEKSDPQRQTEARLLWSPDHLFVRFLCRYREIYIYDGPPRRRDKLWLRDVADMFVQPDSDGPGHYKEFEVGPNGDWLDLDIDNGRKSILFCGLKIRVTCDSKARIWIAALAIPMNCLTARFDPGRIWRINLFRIEGQEPNRFYSAWRPTHTVSPNFHVPELFGELHFS
jgi:hypothetical protein